MKALEELREENGLSLSKLTTILNKRYTCDIKICQVWEWENDHTKVSNEEAQILADYFQVSKDKFIK
ncbi:helix-turn-helix transcriptional regulator [Staphylococcus sp. GSSP0090]|nr:helix-turn-helix transcriptional regulator [Staphylococcus sp. GSSP0090]